MAPMPTSERRSENRHRVDVYVHLPEGVETSNSQVLAKLDQVLAGILQLKQGDTAIMADLSELTASVAENTSVDQSAIVLLNDIAARLEAAATDPAAVADLAASIRSSSAELAAAVAANTPAAPPVEEPPAEPPVEPPA